MKKLIGTELLKHRVILDSLLFHHVDLYVQECVYWQSPELTGLSRFHIK